MKLINGVNEFNELSEYSVEIAEYKSRKTIYKTQGLLVDIVVNSGCLSTQFSFPGRPIQTRTSWKGSDDCISSSPPASSSLKDGRTQGWN